MLPALKQQNITSRDAFAAVTRRIRKAAAISKKIFPKFRRRPKKGRRRNLMDQIYQKLFYLNVQDAFIW